MSVRDYRTSATVDCQQCPLPKRSFTIRLWRNDAPGLDAFQEHLLKGRDIKGRKRFVSLLAQRGYHYETADVLGPICSEVRILKTHGNFNEHLIDGHFGSFRLFEAGDDWWFS